MKKLIIYTIYLVVFSTTFLSFGQTKMEYNLNEIDLDFKPNEELIREFNDLKKSSDEIQLILKSGKDSLVTIYVKNNINESIKTRMQDQQLIIIQEAKNKKGEWKPIEYWIDSDCGNSYESLYIKSKNIIKTETRAYNKGKFNTEIRIKFLNNNKVYYSNSIQGKIDLSQFKVNIPKYLRNVEKIIGKETNEKMLFLVPNGQKEVSEKYAKYYEEKEKKNRKNKITKQ
ncbi:MAG: hypothetical protein V4548_01000 [Bacteroidota bacterium]